MYRIRWKRIAVGVLEQWHEKQFVGRWARKRRAVWMEILEVLVKREPDIEKAKCGLEGGIRATTES